MKSAVLLLLVATAKIISAQDVLKTLPPPGPPTASPITLGPPPPSVSPPVCLADTKLLAETSADTSEDAGDAAESLTIVPPVQQCEQGPVKKIHSIPNQFHWPPIYKGSCDNLHCKNPPCFPRRTVWRRRCVLVYKLLNGCWRRIGYRTIWYLDHLSCGCKQCSDIRTRNDCIRTKPCPNNNKPNSFCYWTYGPTPIGKRQAEEVAPVSILPVPIPIPVPHGRCSCCVPFSCPYPKFFDNATCSCRCPLIRCPPGRIFNPKTCQCDCPPGSYLSGSKCIGNCGAVGLRHCRFTHCRDNQHLLCQVNQTTQKCFCPSCDSITNASTCTRTDCLTQPSKPHCVYDYSRRQCRCPACQDQHEEEWCHKTSCGPNNQSCRFNSYHNTCYCPYH